MGRKSTYTTFAISALLSLANAVSLASFQQIPSNVQVPLSCNLAYASSIPFCQVSDFTNGAACSIGCQSSLSNVALMVNRACAGVVVDGSTLLGKVFQGELVNILCPNAAPVTSAVTVAKTTTKPLATTTPPTSIVSSNKKTTVSSTTESISTSQASSSQSSSLQSTGNGLVATTATSNQGRPTASASNTSSASSTKTSAAIQSPKYPSVLEQQIAAIKDSGGGSPFDFISAGTSNVLPRIEVITCWFLALMVILTR